VDKFTHFDDDGKAVMVDITEKKITERIAVATGEIVMNKETLEAVKKGNIKKGDVLGVARIAAIMAAKQTHSLIPMCHNILLTNAKIEFSFDDEENKILIKSTVKTTGKTGVEMEALTMVAIAGLTIYDMCKSMDKFMVIGEITLVEKHGGKSGDWIKNEK
jgi:molybdenum cofactor biosynthesis protein C